MRVLVVEDDADVGADLVKGLESAGFAAELSRDGEDAWFRGDVDDYSAVILDLGLPRLDGLSVLKKWRAAGRSFPVMILSARGDWMDKVVGIEVGADDYLAKPFEMGELVTRVRALIRRAGGHAAVTICVGKLSIDTSRMTVSVGGQSIHLSSLEYRLLHVLAHSRGRPVSAGELADQLYGTAAADTNAIEALVTRLRRKLGPELITNRRGFGYSLAEASE